MNLESIITNETEWLLYNLWKRDIEKPAVKYNFIIPDTVIYKYVSYQIS
jgi:hypothetical protein